MKTGKSTFGSQLPRALFLNFEQGTNALSGVRAAPILKWTDCKSVVAQLKKPQAREMYDSIVVDTLTIAWTLCEKYICQRENVESIRDIPWGQGFGMVKQEFQETFREISLLGFGILFIAHSKERASEMTDEEGNAISTMAPDVPNACYNIVNGMVDIIGYLAVEMNKDGTSERYLYTRATPTVFAGSRYQYLEPKIKFGYTELVNAIGDAIDKAVQLDGAEVTDNTHIAQITRRPFNEIMEEAKDFWVTYLNGATTDEEKERRANVMNDIISKVFGKQMKLSAALPSQSDLVELCIDEFKALV